MFDMFGTDEQSSLNAIVLPETEPVSSREMLSWEKELVGFYVSEHPLNQLSADLSDTITCFCGEINEAMHGKTVVVAGVVDWVRHHLTKKGDPMAFVHLEDIQGSITVVVFPRTFAATRDLWQEDRILIVRGKVDAERREPQILCESVQDHVVIARASEAEPSHVANSTGRYAPQNTTQYKPAAHTITPRTQEVTGEIREKTTPEENTSPLPQQSQQQTAAQPSSCHLNITITQTGDQAQDKNRVLQIYKLLQRSHGRDRFTFYVVNGRQRVQIDFPNATTGFTPELSQSLTTMLGQDSLQVL